MNEKKEAKKLLSMAIFAGKIMLENGAETYRVEDTITRICTARKFVNYAEPFVIPTGIFMSIGYKDEVITYIQRTKTKKIDLNKITLVNEFSRQFVNSNISIDKAFQLLHEIDSTKAYPRSINLLFGGFAGGFFSILFGGTFWDFVSAFFVSVLVVEAKQILERYNIMYFINNFIGALVATIFAIFFTEIGIGHSMDTIIIGSIMPLVPGVAITNATRDSILGDFLSGISRGMEAVIVALSIAFGVGLTLRLYFLYFGGM